jgi:hypothetical protein
VPVGRAQSRQVGRPEQAAELVERLDELLIFRPRKLAGGLAVRLILRARTLVGWWVAYLIAMLAGQLAAWLVARLAWSPPETTRPRYGS